MKSLTIQNFLMLAILFLGLGMLTTSCQKEPCEDLTCQNGGECIDGECDCPDRYTGEECQTDKCEGVNCQNGGSRVVTGSNCECDCPERYTGEECETDKCENVSCVNGSYNINSAGNCECECNTGYEGDSCNTAMRAKFVDSYSVEDSCDDGSVYNYASDIVIDNSNIKEIDIQTLGGFSNTTINATISGSTSFNIPNQTDANGREWTGSGSYNSSTDEVIINYTVTFSDNTSDNCEATYTP